MLACSVCLVCPTVQSCFDGKTAVQPQTGQTGPGSTPGNRFINSTTDSPRGIQPVGRFVTPHSFPTRSLRFLPNMKHVKTRSSGVWRINGQHGGLSVIAIFVGRQTSAPASRALSPERHAIHIVETSTYATRIRIKRPLSLRTSTRLSLIFSHVRRSWQLGWVLASWSNSHLCRQTDWRPLVAGNPPLRRGLSRVLLNLRSPLGTWSHSQMIVVIKGRPLCGMKIDDS